MVAAGVASAWQRSFHNRENIGLKDSANAHEALTAIRHARAGTNSLIGDAVAVYFRSADVALAFTEAFPLALANDTW